MIQTGETKLRTYFVKKFAKHLKRLRQARHMTQEELAFGAGFSPEYISHLERGRHGPTAFACWKIAQALRMELSDFWKHF